MIKESSFKNLLYIRSYLNTASEGHFHDFNQLIIPLTTYLDTGVRDNTVRIRYGEALLVSKGVFHKCLSDNNFKFLTVNLHENIDSLWTSEASMHFSLDEKTLLFLTFMEKQLQSACDQQAEAQMFALLKTLLGSMTPVGKTDPRLLLVIEVMKNDLAGTHTISSLAQIACLSESQFKMTFKKQFTCTPLAYLTEIRMQSALSLMLNTDIPVAIVAEQCGYNNTLSLVRNFKKRFNQTPSERRKRHLAHSN
ncbi:MULTISPECIES: AraC family transcriptional regulator [unclassified Psychrobacter]|uniref:AraC family transcriptional regulator n=1 Tax=unclassified Psychrobacter TaxID=196806 RepID=UPI0025ED0879|nr:MULTISPECIES: AraC family transcriptional regulator [unclassified Psychrobacter]